MAALVDELDPRRPLDAVRTRFLSDQLARLATDPDLPAGVLDGRLLSRILAVAHLSPGERALLRGMTLPAPAAEAGAVTCALVTARAPYEALVRRLRIRRSAEQADQACFPSSFDPHTRAALAAACEAMQDHLRRRWFTVPLQLEARHRVQLEQGPDVEVAGRSLGGAAALAYFSLWTSVQVPATVAVIAAVEPGEHGRGVLRETDEAALWHKVEALVRERPWLRRVVVPRSQLRCVPTRLRSRLVPADTLEELLWAALGPAYEERITVPAGINLPNEVQRAEADYRGGHDRRPWSHKARRFEALAAALPADEANARFRCRCLAYQASCHLHQGETALADPLLHEALSLYDRFNDTADWSFLPWVLDRMAMSQLDVYDVDGARERAARALDLARECRLNLEIVSKLHGTLGQILLAAGDLKGAVEQLSAALDGIHRVKPDECVRNHTYLVRAHGAAGDVARATAQYEAAVSHLARLPEDNRLTHKTYLRYAMAGVYMGQGQASEAADLLAGLPLPALEKIGPIAARIHKLLVRAYLALGQQDEALEHHRMVADLVGPSPTSRLRWLQATADLELAAGRLEQGGEDKMADQRERIDAALACLPSFPGAQKRFGAVMAEVRDLLAGDAGPLCEAIRRLLSLEIY